MVTSAAMPFDSRGSAVSATLAASSNSPLMAIRKSGAVRAITTPPSVALRARTSPSAGARTSVLDSCTSTFCRCASITPSRASLAFSAFSAEVELCPGAVQSVDGVVELGLGRDPLLLQRLGTVERLAAPA